VHRLKPFTIRLIDCMVAQSTVQPVMLKIDPRSKATGIAIARVSQDPAIGETHHALSLIELEHRGSQIRKSLKQRAAFRRRRRNANLRYRPARFNNRTKPKGWLAPSLRHRVETTTSWAKRLQRLAPITSIAMELVRFDTHALSDPGVAEAGGVAYQQGTLQGFEIREYLLEKWGRNCAYCAKQGVPLQVEHIVPRSRGGSNRISNLTLACEPCNKRKGAQPVETFLAAKPKILAQIKAQAKAPLRDAAAMNSTRWALLRSLKTLGLPTACGSGGQTKWNRTRCLVPKSHALDALCVGTVDHVQTWNLPTLAIQCTGRGTYRRTRLTKHGFPHGFLMRSKSVHSFQTGDLVKANVPDGKKQGIHQGRVAVRSTGSFAVQTKNAVIDGISWKHCQRLQRADGYGYQQNPVHNTTERKGASSPP
jgi:5-methylcytosine-specific restriction endonuclease McrA